VTTYVTDHDYDGVLADFQLSPCKQCGRPLSAHVAGGTAGPPAALPTTAELDIEAELWNALAARVTRRTGRQALFSTRDRLARTAVVFLDAVTDAWLAERAMVIEQDEPVSP